MKEPERETFLAAIFLCAESFFNYNLKWRDLMMESFFFVFILFKISFAVSLFFGKYFRGTFVSDDTFFDFH